MTIFIMPNYHRICQEKNLAFMSKCYPENLASLSANLRSLSLTYVSDKKLYELF